MDSVGHGVRGEKKMIEHTFPIKSPFFIADSSLNMAEEVCHEWWFINHLSADVKRGQLYGMANPNRGRLGIRSLH